MKILTIVAQARTIGFHGFILFLPCSIAFSQICLSLLALTYLLEAFLTRQFSIPSTPVNRPLCLYFGVRLMTTIIALDFSAGVKEIADILVVAVFFLSYLALQNVTQLQRTVRLLGLYVTLAAVYGITQHFWEIDTFRLTSPISFLKHVDDDLTAPVRIAGFLSYMTFSGHLAMTIPLIFALFLSLKQILKKLVWGIAMILTFLAILWTYTRSAWIATMSALVLFGLLRGKKVLILLLAVGIFLVVLTIFQPELLDRSLSVFRTKENQERLYTWQSTIAMIRDHPLTGIGKGNYARLAPLYRTQYNFEFSSRAHAHNNILAVAVTTGIPSALCFLWLWIVIFHEAYRTYSQLSEKTPALKMLSLAFFGAITAFFVQGFFEHNFGDAEAVMMFWLIVAFALKLQSLTARQ